MAVKHQICVALVTSALLAFLTGASLAVPVKDGNGSDSDNSNFPLSLQKLGEADGKQYFAELNQTMNWTDAGDFCRNLGLKLASLETPNQVDLVKSVLAKSHPAVWFYTSGIEMPVWNETREDIDQDLFDNVMPFRGFGCVQLVHRMEPEGPWVQFSGRECSELARPICSTTSA